ncbi:MAG TPA: hypothetical protein VMW58_13390 [Anaerolineae bacterium]|nr:hypothetical protein [Anaerolineae bacterium]
MTETQNCAVGDVLVYQSRWPNSPPGPVIEITEFQEGKEGPVIIGTVIDTLGSPYTVGLPFVGMARNFDHYEPPEESPKPLTSPSAAS